MFNKNLFCDRKDAVQSAYDNYMPPTRYLEIYNDIMSDCSNDILMPDTTKDYDVSMRIFFVSRRVFLGLKYFGKVTVFQAGVSIDYVRAENSIYRVHPGIPDGILYNGLVSFADESYLNSCFTCPPVMTDGLFTVREGVQCLDIIEAGLRTVSVGIYECPFFVTTICIYLYGTWDLIKAKNLVAGSSYNRISFSFFDYTSEYQYWMFRKDEYNKKIKELNDDMFFDCESDLDDMSMDFSYTSEDQILYEKDRLQFYIESDSRVPPLISVSNDTVSNFDNNEIQSVQGVICDDSDLVVPAKVFFSNEKCSYGVSGDEIVVSDLVPVLDKGSGDDLNFLDKSNISCTSMTVRRDVTSYLSDFSGFECERNYVISNKSGHSVVDRKILFFLFKMLPDGIIRSVKLYTTDSVIYENKNLEFFAEDNEYFLHDLMLECGLVVEDHVVFTLHYNVAYHFTRGCDIYGIGYNSHERERITHLTNELFRLDDNFFDTSNIYMCYKKEYGYKYSFQNALLQALVVSTYGRVGLTIGYIDGILFPIHVDYGFSMESCIKRRNFVTHMDYNQIIVFLLSRKGMTDACLVTITKKTVRGFCYDRYSNVMYFFVIRFESSYPIAFVLNFIAFVSSYDFVCVYENHFASWLSNYYDTTFTDICLNCYADW